MAWSKEKQREYCKTYYQNHKEKSNLSSKTWNITHKQQNKENKLLYAEKNREKIMVLCAKRNAKNQNLPFNLEITDIIIPKYCPYLKIKITNIRGKGRIWTNASLDRIIPKLGYIKGNIQVISMLANLMKAHATKEQLIQFAKTILNNNNNK